MAAAAAAAAVRQQQRSFRGLLVHLSSASSSVQYNNWSLVRSLASSAAVVISPEAAKALSQHGAGLVRLPQDVASTLDAYFKEVGLTGKHAKQRAAELTDQLKALSRSQPAGGLQPYRTPGGDAAGSSSSSRQQQAAADHAMTAEQVAEQEEMDADLEKMAASLGDEVLADVRRMRAAAAAAAQLPLPRTRAGRIKASAKAALEEHIAQHGVLGLPHEAVRVALDLPPSSDLLESTPARLQELKQATPKYTEAQAIVYGLSRLPACFAANSRIFRELRVRLPDFQPATMLDFGAGPGTAAWAAQEVWPETLSRLVAVEPSPAMRQLGVRLEAARRFAHPTAPLVRWRPELPAAALSEQRRKQQQKHDLVVASYVLGELPTHAERQALVRRLWGLTAGMLVLVEPGTPNGAAIIQEARAAVLQYEARRVGKLQQRVAAEGPAAGADHNLPAKAASKWFGAHVVAPCPHDGPCPLAAPGSKSWCHFGTRFQRPGFMQEAKATRGHRINPADYQDERYAYVVLSRGVRPPAVQDVKIGRSFRPKQPASSLQQSGTSAQSSSIHWEAAGSDSDGGGASSQQPWQQASSGSDSAPQQLFRSDDMAELSALLGSSSSDGSRQPSQLVDSTAHAGSGNEHLQHVNAKLQGYGQGLIDRLMQMEDSGVDWAAAGADGLSLDAVTAARSSSMPQTPQPRDDLPDPLSEMSSFTTTLDTEEDEESAAYATDIEPAVLDMAQGLTAASAATASWSRIIRPPRKRGGHVILDVCAACEQASPDTPSSSSGHIMRHIIARSDASKWMGKAGYEMAHDAVWGDLWPGFYSQNPKQQVVKD